ncbi:MAG: BolA family transcriptional regulator [Gallionella sp.]|jgi:BolA protein|nr:BolA family transcriptional regulator [Gallionella sp.]
MNRIAMMTERLAVLHPIKLEIVDESHKHAGHAGARSGGGHYWLQIISADFAEKNKTSRQRMVYSALAEMMERDIHALTIDAKTPGEIE